MRNKRLILALTGAVLCGLLAVMLVTRYLASVQAYARDLNNVVVAKTEIPVGAKITVEQLALLPIPNGSAPEGAFRKLEEAVDRVAVIPIGVREPITNNKLAPVGTESGLSAVIPPGFRALTVKVDEVVGVSGFVMPGSYVDVVAVIIPVAAAQSAQGPISKIVLQNIKVLANGQNIDKPKDEREANSVKAVTLQVTPEQAEKLALAASEGKLQLVMRSQIDQGDEQTPGVNKRGLLTGEKATQAPEPGSLKSEQPKSESKPVRRVSAAPKPVAAAPAPQPTPRTQVEMIEGAKKRNVEFP